jgi:hypothetical protein
MCSDGGSAEEEDQVAELIRAIDDLAAANPASLTAAELTGRVARVWMLVGELDPELARRAAGYVSPALARRDQPPTMGPSEPV